MIQHRLPATGKRSFFRGFPVRFIILYFVFQIVSFPFNSVRYFSFATDAASRLFDRFVLWAGLHVLQIPSFTITQYNGSGDRLFNYVSLFVIAVLALIAAIVWQVWSQKRDRYENLIYWLTAYIHFFFALTMMKYGMEKVIQMQFPFPYTSLMQTYGQSSPMRLMWSFVGYSKTYNFALGATEMISGFLVLFRRTMLAGALLGIAIMSHVVLLNFCYDVPVKLFSINFLLMAVFIAAPDMKRLTDFFLLNKTVVVRSIPLPVLSRKTWQWLFAAKYFIAIVVLGFALQRVRLNYSLWGNGAFAQTPLFGIYEVAFFVKNKDTLPPLQTDAARWKAISLIYRKEADIKMMNDTIRSYRFFADTTHQKIEITGKKDTSSKAVFFYSQPDTNALLMKGRWKNDSLTILLKKQDMNQYQLINRGFHWINEYPYR